MKNGYNPYDGGYLPQLIAQRTPFISIAGDYAQDNDQPTNPIQAPPMMQMPMQPTAIVQGDNASGLPNLSMMVKQPNQSHTVGNILAAMFGSNFGVRG